MATSEQIVKRLGKLRSTLLTSGLSQSNQPLFQVINELLQAVIDSNSNIVNITGGGGGTGAAGATGGIGLQGPPGMDGEPGQDGETIIVPGSPGPIGPTGPPGASGNIGPPGYDGEDGEASYIPGPMGPPGSGTVGPPGPQGLIGLPGSDGIDGEDSLIPGPIGPSGSNGSNGATGATGPQGSIGPPGIDAEEPEYPYIIQGPIGPTGATGASSGITTLKTTSNQTINSGAGVFVDITGLTFSVVNGQRYAFKFYIVFQSALSTTGWKAAVNHPGGTLSHFSHIQTVANGAAGLTTWPHKHNTAVDDMTLLTSTVTAGVDLVFIIEGRYLCTANGTFAARFANELAADTNITVREGSWGFYF